MKNSISKLLNPSTYTEKTTWLGLFVLAAQTFNFQIPLAIEGYAASILAGLAGIALVLVSPKAK